MKTRLALRLAVVLALSLAATPGSPSDWPQLLGPDRDGRSPDAVAVPADGSPPVLWRFELGSGYAGPAIADGTLVIFHRRGELALIEALDVASGRSLWSFSYPTDYRDDYGAGDGPRATPTIAGGRVFTFGAEGRLQALRLADGEPLWSVDTRRAFDVEKGFFGTATSPLADGRAVKLADGRLLWERPDVRSGFVLLARDDLVIVTEGGELVIAPASGAGFEPKLRTKILGGEVRATPALASGRLYARDDRGLVAVDLRPP